MSMRSVILTILGVLLASEAEAQTVHGVIIGDTLGTLKGGARRNIEKMGSLLESVRTVGEIQMSVEEIRDDQFGCTSITDAVQRIKAKMTENDAVIFYYSGHGFRRPNTTTNFPLFACATPTDEPQPASTNIGLADVVGQLTQDKKPRFLLAIADSCNVVIRFGEEAGERGTTTVPKPILRAGFRQLFLNYRGTLTMSAAQPGETAWYRVLGPASNIGGFFTNQFFDAVDANISATKGINAKWEDIARMATARIVISTPNGRLTQTPQFAASNDLIGKVGR